MFPSIIFFLNSSKSHYREYSGNLTRIFEEIFTKVSQTIKNTVEKFLFSIISPYFSSGELQFLPTFGAEISLRINTAIFIWIFGNFFSSESTPEILQGIDPVMEIHWNFLIKFHIKNINPPSTVRRSIGQKVQKVFASALFPAKKKTGNSWRNRWENT